MAAHSFQQASTDFSSGNLTAATTNIQSGNAAIGVAIGEIKNYVNSGG